MKPLILVTNDDGITAPGILALMQTMSRIGEVIVVAPDKPQSGSGHAITINSTLRINKVNIENVSEAYSCSGTPVDCVKMAVNHIMKRKPDLLVSGVNHGPNYSINVIYSGTMSAAVEGALENIPSIGFSLLDYSIDADFECSKVIAETLAKKVLKNGLPQGVCLNVNIPKLHYNEIMGIKVCRQATANWEEEFDVRKDPSGKEYFWMTGSFKNYDSGSDTDIWALENSYVSVVPTQFDLTAHSHLKKVTELIK
jgi:5'-nucleotidase